MSFLRRRGGDNAGIYDVIDFRSDYQRLRLLENAVINYGGGRRELEARVRMAALHIRETDAGAAAVLNDAAAYLRDVAIAGSLEEHDRVGLRAHREAFPS